MSDQKHVGEIAGTRWNPGQYHQFSDHRLRPAIELLDRIPHESPKLVYDLGCGTGNVTRLIADRWSGAEVIGIDSSKEMLEKAGSQPGDVRWIEADIRSWAPEENPDVIYSNATLQWLESHEDLFPRLASFAKEGGCLAVQMPLSWDAPSHRLMQKTLADGGKDGGPLGTEELRQAIARRWVDGAEVYYEMLAGCAKILDIWETEYMQVLEGDDPVLEWVKGTGLRPVLNGLGVDDRETFLAKYRHRLREAYPCRSDGRTIYQFRRLFIVAQV